MNYIAEAEVRHIELALVERLRANRVRVPPYPAVISKLQAVLANRRATAADIAAVVASDTAFAAAILRRGSSAAVGTAVAPGSSSLESAVHKVGADELLHYALVAGVGQAATALGPLVALRRDTWRRALLSARLCHALARRRGLPTGQAFLAGLLHDFGAVVVIAALEDASTLWRVATLPERAWRELVDRHHVEYGKVVASRWGLPDPIVDVIARHHEADPLLSADLVGLCALVDRIIGALDRPDARGLATAREVDGFDEADASDVTAAIADAARQMSTLEPTRAPPVASSGIAPHPEAPDAGWPVDLALAAGDEQLRVTALWPERFECRGVTPIRANWLVAMTLHAPTGPVELVANVRHCRHDAATGDYVATAHPYGLSGRQLAAWHAAVEAARC